MPAFQQSPLASGSEGITVQTLLLWPAEAPHAQGNDPQDQPRIKVYIPPDPIRTGSAMLVVPGGGYLAISNKEEGEPTARWLATLGITAAVVQYRLAPRYRYPVMLDDTIRAMRLLRANAEAWRIDEQKIGVIGFSAGGHLAALLATREEQGALTSVDVVERASAVPNLAVLVYPVITMVERCANRGVRDNLLGSEPTEALRVQASAETQVTAMTPPTFLVCASDDPSVDSENSLLFAQALMRVKAPVELHLYEHGGHSFGVNSDDFALRAWPSRCGDWLKRHLFLQAMDGDPVDKA